MKKMIFNKVFILILLFSIFVFGGTASVFAETTAPEETYAIESFVEETTLPSEEDATEDVTDTTEDITQDVTESSEPTEATTRPEPTYPESLPEVSETDIVIPPVIGELKEENEPALFWGFVAWICIGVGSAVILAVLLTTKTKAYRGGGKKRYSTGDKISGKKRLLNDQYYNNKRK